MLGSKMNVLYLCCIDALCTGPVRREPACARRGGAATTAPLTTVLMPALDTGGTLLKIIKGENL